MSLTTSPGAFSRTDPIQRAPARSFRASPLSHVQECPSCGLFQTLPPGRRGCVADCPRCRKVLHRTRSEPFNRSLALSIAGLAFYLLAVTTPFLSFRLGGQVRDTTLLQFPAWFEQQGFWELDVLVLCTTVVAPLLTIAMTLTVLVGLRGDSPPAWLPVLARWRERLRPWSMIEVFLLGVFVAFTRLNALAAVEVGPALYALGGLMLMTVASDALLDRAAVWDLLGRKCGIAETGWRPGPGRAGPPLSCDACEMVLMEPARQPGRATGRRVDRADCPRCAAPLHRRKPDSIARTWALLVAAAVFYVPANVFPILSLTRLGKAQASTILGGASELLQAGMWPLALLVFGASILVPTMKLVSLTWMLVATHRGSAAWLRGRTRLYRMVDVIGRWSMIDVFMLAILVALVRMGILAEVQPRVGAACFAAVVILTMLAAAAFDPRLMWDRAGQPTGADQVHPA